MTTTTTRVTRTPPASPEPDPADASRDAETAAPDPVDELRELATNIAELETRRAHLAREETHMTRAVAMASARLGRDAAAGCGADVVAAHRAEIRDAEDEAQNRRLGIDAIDQRLKVLRRQHQALELIQATAHADALRGESGPALRAIDDLVRRFVREQLVPTIATFDAHQNAAVAAWQQLQHLRTKAGVERDQPWQSPYNARWTSFPDLRDLVESLEKYVAGRLPMQRLVADGEYVRSARLASESGRVSRPE